MSPIHSRTCKRAKRIPKTAVIIVQRKAPALSPARAARNPISIVKLLVKRMNVISATLVMLWNGLRQSIDDPLRTTKALVNAANIIEIAKSTTQMAVEDGGGE